MTGRITGVLRQYHARVANATVAVFVPDESYQAGEGFDVSYPETPTAAGIPARADSPTPDATREESGTGASVDRTFRVRADLPVSLTDFDVDGEAAVRLRDDTGRDYLVESVVDERNGLLRLECRER